MTATDGGRHPRSDFGPAAHAELALLLEVAGTPKPGNVDRDHDFADLRFEHFLSGAVGARPGLDAAADPGDPLGAAFERAVAGMSQQRGGNTQFGCLLLLVPLVRTAATGALTRERAAETVEATTVADARAFFAAFEHVDVAVDDPPPDLADLDVGRGAAAGEAAVDRGLTWYDVMARSEGDGNAAAWTEGFLLVFEAAGAMLDDDGPAPDRVARAFLSLLGRREDTLVRVEHGPAVAREIRERAAGCDGLDEAGALAADLRERGINPGTTADATAAATFVALERGLPV
ncbi:MAG: triphosphoribosyl-dephospho-CoA synthase [Haloferacaceae archaeon]